MYSQVSAENNNYAMQGSRWAPLTSCLCECAQGNGGMSYHVLPGHLNGTE